MKKISVVLVSILIVALSFVLLTSCGKKEKNVLTNYEIDINYDVIENEADCNQVVKYHNNTENDLENLCFHIYPKAFSEDAENLPVIDSHIESAYYDGIDYGDIEINRVECEGEELKFQIKNDILDVDIPKLKKNDDISIMINYDLDMPKINHRFGVSECAINLGNFYPQVAMYEDGKFRNDPYYQIGDPFYSEVANYKTNIKIDKNYSVASTGNLTNEKENVKSKTYTFNAQNVRDYAICMSNKFKTIKKVAGQTTVNYFYFDDKDAEKSLDTAVKSIKTFNDFVGVYPYKTFNVVETGFCFGGMEYPNLIYISNDLTEENRDKVIVHETAHQWSYGLIGNDSIKDAWMDEGLTEFLTALYFKQNDDMPTMKNMINSSFITYKLFNGARIDVERENYDTSMNRGLSEYRSESEYIVMAYTKGMLMFNTIYELVGHNKFQKAMKTYFKNYCYKIAKPQDMKKCFNKECGIDIDTIFDSWLEGKVVISTFKAS